MRRREITEKLHSIVDFAGVREFIDTPVKRYSSGMHVRLGFSIAAHLNADILLLDEVLAVGDAAFQQKCLTRVSEMKRNGTTVVFISHDLNAVERLCNRVLLFDRGKIIASGPPPGAIANYQRLTTPDEADLGYDAQDTSRRVKITSVRLYDRDGRQGSAFSTAMPLIIRLAYAASEPLDDPVFEVFFYSHDGELQCQLTTDSSGGGIKLPAGTGSVDFSCAQLGLAPGTYYVDASVKHPRWSVHHSSRCRASLFRVAPGKEVRGHFYMSHEWRINDGNGSA